MIEQLITFLVLGILLIVLGVLAVRGNVSMLHSYHRKRVSQADLLPFGRLIGIGNFVIGGGMIVSGVLPFVADRQGIPALFVAAYVLLGVTLLTGLGISFYAMIKYNKGIF